MDYKTKMGINETLSYWWFCLANNLHLKIEGSNLPEGEYVSETSKAHNKSIRKFTLKAIRNGWSGAISRSLEPISWSREACQQLLASGSENVIFVVKEFLGERVILNVSDIKQIVIDKNNRFDKLTEEEYIQFKRVLIRHASIPKEYVKLFYLEQNIGEKNDSIANSLLEIFGSDREFIKYLAMRRSTRSIANCFFGFASNEEKDAYIKETSCLYCFDGLCTLEELIRNRHNMHGTKNIFAFEQVLLENGGSKQVVAYINEYGLQTESLPALLSRKIMSEIEAYNDYRLTHQ